MYKGNQSTINPFGRGFVMAALNINSLVAHFDDLNFFVLNCKIDILAINETKIDCSVDDNEIHLPGFEDLLGRIALLMAEVVVVFVCIYGIT